MQMEGMRESEQLLKLVKDHWEDRKKRKLIMENTGKS